MILYKKLLLFAAGLLIFSILTGQQSPSKPFSYPLSSQFLINPAIAGSRDFSNINMILRVNGMPGAQMITYNTRLPGKAGDQIFQGGNAFSNFGIGGFAYQESFDLSRNYGFGVAGSYHISLGDNNLSALSIGLAARGTYNTPTDEAEPDPEGGSLFTPNVDFGIYYYGTTGFAGISGTNLLGMMNDSTMAYGDEGYVPRAYNFFGGYKFVLSRKNAIVLEPSLLVSLNDSTFLEAGKHITPYLKLYMQNFYVGTYFKDVDHLALFMQYQFPWFYTGLLVEFPRQGFLTDDNIILELTLGLNLSKDKQAFYKERHW